MKTFSITTGSILAVNIMILSKAIKSNLLRSKDTQHKLYSE